MIDLEHLYNTLPLPPHSADNERVFSIAPFPGRPDQLIGRTLDDRPAILIEMVPDKRVHAPILLQHLRVTFNVRCRFSLNNKSQDVLATVIECLAEDRELRRYFLIVAARIFEQLELQASTDQIVAAIDALASLFQRLSHPSIKGPQGLFGELIVIDLATNPIRLMEAWRADQFEHFDFALNRLRLEVKTSSLRQRRHQFSMEQCIPPEGTEGILGSVFVERSGGGLALDELILRIEKHLTARPDLVVKLHSVVAGSLGATLPQVLAHRFDEHLARASVVFYDLATIPAIRGPVPNEVSDVRFTVELGAMAAMSARVAGQYYDSFRQVFLA